MKKLHLGCGKHVLEGYVNCDSVKLPGVDVVWNLNKTPWPFKKGEFDRILADNVVEHLDSVTTAMEEIWRITKKGAMTKIIVPVVPSVWAFIDPTHKQFLTLMSFDYFTKESGLGKYYSKARFIIKKKKLIFHPLLRFMQWINVHERIQKFYYVFVAQLLPPRFLEIDLETAK